MSKKLTREFISQKAKSDRIQNIKNLNLWGTNLDDVSIIKEMPALEIVSLSVNKIRSLQPFSNLQNLRELYLRKNLIADIGEIEYLRKCDNLRILWLSENPICNIKNYRCNVIRILPQLVKLDDLMITDAERDKAENADEGMEEIEEENRYEEEEYNEDDNGREEVIKNFKRRPTFNVVNRFKDKMNVDKNVRRMSTHEIRKLKDEKKEEEYYKGNRFENINEISDDYGYYGNRKESFCAKEQNKNIKKSNILESVLLLIKELDKNELYVLQREVRKVQNKHE